MTSVDECKKMMEKKLVKIEDLKAELNSSHQILSPDSPKVKDMPEKGSTDAFCILFEQFLNLKKTKNRTKSANFRI